MTNPRVGDQVVTLSTRLPWPVGTEVTILRKREHRYLGMEYLLVDLPAEMAPASLRGKDLLTAAKSAPNATRWWATHEEFRVKRSAP